MELLIKQRVFSWTDTYDVYDYLQEPKYFVKGELFSIGHQIHVYDKRTGQEVGAIHQKFLALTPKFDVVINGHIIGSIQKKFTLLRPKFEIDYNEWEVEGDFFQWNYSVLSDSNPIMTIKKEPLRWGDTFVLNFIDPEHELMGLLLVLAIDAANCSQEN